MSHSAALAPHGVAAHAASARARPEDKRAGGGRWVAHRQKPGHGQHHTPPHLQGLACATLFCEMEAAPLLGTGPSIKAHCAQAWARPVCHSKRRRPHRREQEAAREVEGACLQERETHQDGPDDTAVFPFRRPFLRRLVSSSVAVACTPALRRRHPWRACVRASRSLRAPPWQTASAVLHGWAERRALGRLCMHAHRCVIFRLGARRLSAP